MTISPHEFDRRSYRQNLGLTTTLPPIQFNCSIICTLFLIPFLEQCWIDVSRVIRRTQRCYTRLPFLEAPLLIVLCHFRINSQFHIISSIIHFGHHCSRSHPRAICQHYLLDYFKMMNKIGRVSTGGRS